jgi:ubiquitin carboxyl-terminal hydrolase 14
VKVKWNKQVFDKVEANTDEEPMLFKAQLFALTNVPSKSLSKFLFSQSQLKIHNFLPVERQKIMCKGITLKDDEWNFQLKNVILIVSLSKQRS